MALTNKEYLETKGSKCPICSSTHIEASQVEFDGNTLAQEVQCLDCGAGWDDVYATALQGYENLEDGN